MSPTKKFTYQALEIRTKALATALGFRDQSTLEHSDRVQTMATELAKAAGLSEDDISALRISSKFHDIGKIGIPDNILMKPGALNHDDWKMMHQHPIITQPNRATYPRRRSDLHQPQCLALCSKCRVKTTPLCICQSSIPRVPVRTI